LSVIGETQVVDRLFVFSTDFGASGEHVDIVEMEEFVGDPAFGTATTQLYTIHVERGMSFSEAVQKLHEDHHPGEGFYVSKRVRQVMFHVHVRITTCTCDTADGCLNTS